MCTYGFLQQALEMNLNPGREDLVVELYTILPGCFYHMRYGGIIKLSGMFFQTQSWTDA